MACSRISLPLALMVISAAQSAEPKVERPTVFKQPQRFKTYDIAVLNRFRKILDNEIVFLSSQIVSLHNLKRALNQAMEFKFMIQINPNYNESRHRRIVTFLGQMVRHMNYLILHLTRLLRLRHEMQRFIVDQKKNALEWEDDIIKDYPLKLYLDEYLNNTADRLDEIKLDLRNHYNKFSFYISLTVKEEHSDGTCNEKSGPLHWAMHSVNSSFSLDIKRILGGWVDES